MFFISQENSRQSINFTCQKVRKILSHCEINFYYLQDFTLPARVARLCLSRAYGNFCGLDSEQREERKNLRRVRTAAGAGRTALRKHNLDRTRAPYIQTR